MIGLVVTGHGHFSDSVKSNSALVRKRLRDTRLKVEEYKIGVLLLCILQN